MQRVLITGSAGFAGAHLVTHLLRNTDWEIIGIDSFRHRGDSLRVASDRRYTIHCADLGAPISSRLVSRIGEVDFIVNMAAESSVDRSLTDTVAFVQNNVNLALHILEFAKKQSKLQAFIQISTDEVYGPTPEGVEFTEWSTIVPSNPYAASKAAQEALAISYWRSFGVPVVITNTLNMFGESQDPEKYVPRIIRAISKNQKVTVHGTEKHLGKRHYLHARNHADALLFLLHHPSTRYDKNNHQEQRPDRYNVVSEVEMDNLEIAQLIANFLGKPLKYELVDFHKARPGHDSRYALDGRKIAALGWKPPVKFHESLERVVLWSLKHPEWLQAY